MAKIVKRRIRFVPSADADVVSYRVYWNVGGGAVDYNTPNFADFPSTKSQIIVPDELPALASVDDDVTIGVSSVDDIGNESDITIVMVPFDFAAPSAPTGLVVETF